MTPALNTITVGDALDYLEALPAGGVPLFLFSPPYNLGNSGSNTGGGVKHARKLGHYPADAPHGMRGGNTKWYGGPLAGYDETDDNLPWPEYIAWQHAILRACWRALPETGAIYYQHKPRVLDGVLLDPSAYIPAECTIRQRVIWLRAGGVNHTTVAYTPTHEYIFVIAKPDFRMRKGCDSDVWSIPQVANTWHPAPFPLALAERVIATARPSLICDPFIGSGTTAKAATRARIDWMGCEKSTKYAARATLEIEATQPRAAAMIADQEAFI
jgi:site-specific DNA-methyltransferase (adenine-specific)